MGEGANVQLVDDVFMKRNSVPVFVGPPERLGIDYLRCAVDPVRKITGNRVGKALVAEHVAIAVSSFGLCLPGEYPFRIALQIDASGAV